MVKAGELKDRVTLERLQGAGDGVWAAIAATPDVWAAVEPLGADGAFTVRIRYRSDLKDTRDIGRGVRVLHGARVLDVLDVTEVERRNEVHLSCRDRVVNVETVSTGAHGVKGESA